MALLARRLMYRVAAPLAQAYWGLTRTNLRGAKAVILREGGSGGREVLLVRHTYGDRRAWQLPGGLLHRGEQPLAGAVREVREELGLEPGGAARELAVRHLRFWGHVDRVHFYSWTIGEADLRPKRAEIADAGWFALGALPARLGSEVGEVLALLESPAGKPGSPSRAERAARADPQT
ncbi:MAG: hypothetical protein NVSMB51_06240 [Solirubrobacteraceae bacterium]